MKKSQLKTFIDKLHERGYNHVVVINTLLQEASYDDMISFETMLPRVFHGLLRLPYLRRKSYASIYTTGYRITKETPEAYLDIMMYIIKKNADVISQYVKYRDEIENDVLLGKYEQAIHSIHEINENLSYSFWAAITEVKLARLQGGMNACNEKTQELLSPLWAYRSLIMWAYKTSSIDIPFTKEVDDYYKSIKDEGNDFVLNFVTAHCFPYKEYADGIWLSMDFNSSIIDLYVQLFYLIPRLKSQIADSSILTRHLNEISREVGDPVLKKYSQLFSHNWLVINEERDNIEKNYLSGNVEDVSEQAQLFLKANPRDFQMMDIWVKCLIRSNKDIPDSIEDDILFGKIVRYYYHYMKYGSNHNLNYTRLANIYRALFPFVCINQLGAMIEARHKDEITHIYDDNWKYSSYISFSDASFYNQDDRVSFSNRYAISETDEDYNKLLMLGESLHDNEIEDVRSVLKNSKCPPYVKGMLASDVILNYLNQGLVSEAISFYVEQKVIDRNTLIKIDLKVIEDYLRNDGEKNLGIPLYMSIFHTLTNGSSSRRKIAYKRYLRQVGVKKASDLIVDKNDPIVLYFLSDVVDTDVLSLDALTFKSSIEVLEERLKICESLYQATDDKRYYNEIVQLDNERIIKGMTKTLDESKIFVDTEAILEKEIDDVQDLYGLYVHTGDTVKTLEVDESIYELKTSLMTVLEDLRSQGYTPQVYSLQDGVSFQEIEYKNSLFKQFFLRVRNKFLLDPKYGLDYYLSTRIRHGFIANQIRTNFQNKHLVTNKGVDGEYSKDTYWTDNVFCCSGDIKDKCKNRLLVFTKYVDGIITEVKDNLIQVKTEEVNVSKNTCFDYSYPLIAKIIRMVQHECGTRSFEGAVGLVFDYLWLFTEDNLELMRDQLDEVSRNFQAQIDLLEYDILSLIGNGIGSKEFKTAITDSKTKFQNDFQTIAQWFNRQNDLVAEFKLDLSLQTCIGTINKINQYKIDPTPHISSDKVYKGKYLTHFNDLFHNLLNNVLTYNKRKSRNGECDITISEEKEWLCIEVANKIEDEDIEDVKTQTRIDQKEIDEKLSSGGSRKEGHSGIVKIYNIVHNVFGHSENVYQNNVINGKLIVTIRINTNQLVQNNENINS